MTRAAAAEALGQLGDKTTVPALQRLLGDNDPSVRASAAVALGKLGDPAGHDLIAGMIGSDVAEVRLFAAEAYRNSPSPQWVDAVRPSLTDRNGLNRLLAADLLAAADPEAARATLVEAIADPNPVVRAEAGRILVQRELASISVLRKMLRDADSWVRLRASGGVLRAALEP